MSCRPIQGKSTFEYRFHSLLDIRTPVKRVESTGDIPECVELNRENIQGLRILQLYHVLNLLKLPVSRVHCLAGVRKFVASGSALRAIDGEIFQYLPKLEELDLRGNKLSILPEAISNCTKLKIVKLGANAFKHVPLQIGPELTELDMLNNEITEIDPAFFVKSKELQIINLEGNMLGEIPPSIRECLKLRSIYLRNNPLTRLPPTLWAAPSLTETSLDWYRYCAPPLPRHLQGEELREVINTIKSKLQNNASVFEALKQSKHEASLYTWSDDTSALPADKMQLFPCLALIILLSKKPVRVSAVDKAQRTRLHVAASEGNTGVLEALLHAGANPDVLDDQFFSPLLYAVRTENLACTSALLRTGASVDFGGGIFGSPLHVATVNTDVQLTSLLLRHGANPNHRDRDGNTPLHVLFSIFDAGGNRSIAIAVLLLLKGADCNAVGREKWAPIHLAARRNQIHAFYFISDCKMLQTRLEASLRAGSATRHCLASAADFDLDLRGGTQAWTALHLAAHAGLAQMVILLVKIGANVLRMNSCLRTPRDVAAGQFETSKLLCAAEKQWLYWKICKSHNWPTQASHAASSMSLESSVESLTDMSQQSSLVTSFHSHEENVETSREADILPHSTPLRSIQDEIFQYSSRSLKTHKSFQIARTLLSPQKRAITSTWLADGHRMSRSVFEAPLVPSQSSFEPQNLMSLEAELATFVDPFADEEYVISQIMSHDEHLFIRECTDHILNDPLSIGSMRYKKLDASSPISTLRCGEQSLGSEGLTLCAPPLSESTIPTSTFAPALHSLGVAPLTARTIARGSMVNPSNALPDVPEAVIKRSSFSPHEGAQMQRAENFRVPPPLRTIRLRDSSRSTTRPVLPQAFVNCIVSEDSNPDKRRQTSNPSLSTEQRPTPGKSDYDAQFQNEALMEDSSASRSLRSQKLHQNLSYKRQAVPVSSANECPKGAYRVFQSFMRIAKASASTTFDEADKRALAEWFVPIENRVSDDPDRCRTNIRNALEILTVPLMNCEANPIADVGYLTSSVIRLSVWLTQERIYDTLTHIEARHLSNMTPPSYLRVPRLQMVQGRHKHCDAQTSSLVSDILLRLASIDLPDLFSYFLSRLRITTKRNLACERNAHGETLLHRLLSLEIPQIAVYVRLFLQFCHLEKSDLDVANPNDHNQTALHTAVKKGLQDVVQVLLLRGADPNVCDDQGNAPIHAAIWSKKMSCLLTFLYHPSINLDTQDGHGRSLLASAVDAGDIQALSILINRGVPAPAFGTWMQSDSMDLYTHVCNLADRRLSAFLTKLLVTNGLLPIKFSPQQLKDMTHLSHHLITDDRRCKFKEDDQLGDNIETVVDADNPTPFPLEILLGQPLGHATVQKLSATRSSTSRNLIEESFLINREPYNAGRGMVDRKEFRPVLSSGVTSRCIFTDNLQTVCLACSKAFWHVSVGSTRARHNVPSVPNLEAPKVAVVCCRNCSLPICDDCKLLYRRSVIAPFPFLEDLPRRPERCLIFQVVPSLELPLRSSTKRHTPEASTETVSRRCGHSRAGNVGRGSGFLSCGVTRRHSMGPNTVRQNGSVRLLQVKLCRVGGTPILEYSRSAETPSDKAIERAFSSAPKDVLAMLALESPSQRRCGIKWDDARDAGPRCVFTQTPSPGDADEMPCVSTISEEAACAQRRQLMVESLEHWAANVSGVRSSLRRLAASGSFPFTMRSVDGNAMTASSFLLGLCTPRIGKIRGVSIQRITTPVPSFIASLFRGAFLASEYTSLMTDARNGNASKTRSFSASTLHISEPVFLCPSCAYFFSSLPTRFNIYVQPRNVAARTVNWASSLTERDSHISTTECPPVVWDPIALNDCQLVRL